MFDGEYDPSFPVEPVKTDEDFIELVASKSDLVMSKKDRFPGFFEYVNERFKRLTGKDVSEIAQCY